MNTSNPGDGILIAFFLVIIFMILIAIPIGLGLKWLFKQLTSTNQTITPSDFPKSDQSRMSILMSIIVSIMITIIVFLIFFALLNWLMTA